MRKMLAGGSPNASASRIRMTPPCLTMGMDSPLWRSRRVPRGIRYALPHRFKTFACWRVELSRAIHPLPIEFGILCGDFIVGSPFEFAKMDFGKRINCLHWTDPLPGENPGALEASAAWTGVNGRKWLPAEHGPG